MSGHTACAMTTIPEAHVEKAALEWLAGPRLTGRPRAGHRPGVERLLPKLTSGELRVDVEGT